MSCFIYTPKGYVNLSSVEQARINQDGRHSIVVDGKIVDDNHVDFRETIVSIVPINGEWECLYPHNEEDNTKSLLSEPILAWGLTVLGSMVPITPSGMGGVHERVALRKVGDTRIYEGGAIGGFDDLNSWLQGREK